MAARKKTHGAPDSRLYESPEVMALFEPIRLWLSKNCKKVKCYLRLPPFGAPVKAYQSACMDCVLFAGTVVIRSFSLLVPVVHL